MIHEAKHANGVSNRLYELERKIHEGVLGVADALDEILKHELYLETHESFKKYCPDRWGFTDKHAYQMIKNAKTVGNVSTIVDADTVKTLKGTHLKVVGTVPEKKQGALVADVLKACEEQDRRPTEKDFKKAAAALSAPKETKPKPNPEAEPQEEEETPEPKKAANEALADKQEVSGETITDKAGRTVPESLKEHQGLSVAIDSVAREFNGPLKKLDGLADKLGGEFLEFTAIKTAITELKSMITSATYFTHCPRCTGKKKSCELCKGNGYVPRGRKGYMTKEEKELCS